MLSDVAKVDGITENWWIIILILYGDKRLDGSRLQTVWVAGCYVDDVQSDLLEIEHPIDNEFTKLRVDGKGKGVGQRRDAVDYGTKYATVGICGSVSGYNGTIGRGFRDRE